MTGLLQREVQSLITSGNQDGPEGGFDGFLQAIVCQDVSIHSSCSMHHMFLNRSLDGEPTQDDCYCTSVMLGFILREMAR